MLITFALSVLLVLGVLEGAPQSDIGSNEISIHSDKTLLHSRHTVRKQPHQQTTNKFLKSSDPESFNINVVSTFSKQNPPTIVKLYPLTAFPLSMNGNMPMRFGRNSDLRDPAEPNSKNYLPQRFGKSLGLVRQCVKCTLIQDDSSQGLPQRFGRKSPDWSLVRALTLERFLEAGLHWPGNLEFLNNSDDKTELEETFKG